MNISIVNARHGDDDRVLFTLLLDGDEAEFCYSPDDPYSGEVGAFLASWISAGGVIAPYVPPAPVDAPYQIAKTTPWLRMTADEAAIMDAVMSETDARTKQIYMAATYLSSNDELWATLWQLVADNLGEARAAVILAPET